MWRARMLALLLAALLAAASPSSGRRQLLQLPFWSESSRSQELQHAGQRHDELHSPIIQPINEYRVIHTIATVSGALRSLAAQAALATAACRQRPNTMLQDGFGARLPGRQRLQAMAELRADCTRHSLRAQRLLLPHLEGGWRCMWWDSRRGWLGSNACAHQPLTTIDALRLECAAHQPGRSPWPAAAPACRPLPAGGLSSSSRGWHCRAASSNGPVRGRCTGPALVRAVGRPAVAAAAAASWPAVGRAAAKPDGG
jgi:hypothetical protein